MADQNALARDDAPSRHDRLKQQNGPLGAARKARF
jgi:hypothetical protein